MKIFCLGIVDLNFQIKEISKIFLKDQHVKNAHPIAFRQKSII